MLWVPHPSAIVTQHDQGQENMGSVTDKASRARFALSDVPFALCYIRGRFVTLSGAGGNATLSLKLDHVEENAVYDFLLKSWDTMGTSGTGFKADLNFRLAADELYLWAFARGSTLVFEWTSPDSGNIRWALEVGLVDASGIGPTIAGNLPFG